MSEHTTPHLPTDSVTLTSGAAMPLLGFGTWQIKGDAGHRATAAALEAGYRHLDTATVYGNEAEVGRALADERRGPRRRLRHHQVPAATEPARSWTRCAQSLDLLGTDHVDLWLIHWPGDGGRRRRSGGRSSRPASSGLARDIGVSNFDADA